MTGTVLLLLGAWMAGMACGLALGRLLAPRPRGTPIARDPSEDDADLALGEVVLVSVPSGDAARVDVALAARRRPNRTPLLDGLRQPMAAGS
ncbi:hypothetical protein [Enterovirga rhinocerotis]|uniref:Uncharacterized protein n=1 Tax=Enterovirga rhinocerotis TaxID=1339210 RepID=A0A4R7CAW3_9HYPH|nr:hypothetical protein [Enterovirga rhinocerotis]TDR94176.1 hypothetical protein EV668_1454 [Enterovirga rhinocerotis]